MVSWGEVGWGVVGRAGWVGSGGPPAGCGQVGWGGAGHPTDLTLYGDLFQSRVAQEMVIFQVWWCISSLDTKSLKPGSLHVLL